MCVNSKMILVVMKRFVPVYCAICLSILTCILSLLAPVYFTINTSSTPLELFIFSGARFNKRDIFQWHLVWFQWSWTSCKWISYRCIYQLLLTNIMIKKDIYIYLDLWKLHQFQHSEPSNFPRNYTDSSINQSFNQSINQSINHSINQLISQTIIQSINF